MFVSEIIDQVIEVLGRCDRQKALRRISDAVRALQDEGDWNANIGLLDITTFGDGSTVTLPRDVETPLAVAISGMPAFMRDEFFRYHLNGDGLTDDHVVPWAWDDSGVVPNFMDIGTPGPLIARCDSDSDVGTAVRVLGFDADGRELRQQLENGEFIDGIEAYAAEIPGAPTSIPTSVPFFRLFETTPTGTLVSPTPHGLVTGQQMQIQLASGTLPQPLINGAFYFVGVVSATEVILHATRLDAQTNQRPIYFSTVDPAASIVLRETRAVRSRTAFVTAAANLISEGDLVSFSGSPLPLPFESSRTYPASPVASDRFIVYADDNDRENQTNAINATTPGTSVETRILKRMYPLTQLSFTLAHNFLTGDQVTAANSGGELPRPLIENTPYFVRALSPTTVSLHSTSADAASGASPTALENLGTGTSSLVKRISATVAAGGSSIVTTSSPHNLSGPSGSGATATAVLSSQSVTSVLVTAGGSNYDVSPKVTISGGGGVGATAEAIVSGGAVISIRVITGGTGYTSIPTVSFVSQGGNFVSFISNGTLPNPISAETVYRGEAPLTATTFSLNDTIPNPVAITSGGTGQLFLIISRSFSVGFLPQWSVDATALSTGSAVRFYSPGILPGTAPSQVDQSTLYYVRKISNSLVEIYDTSFNANASPPTVTGRFSAVTPGTEDLYLSRALSVTVLPLDNSLDIDFTTFLENLTLIRFTTSGTLPAPLATGTDYRVNIVGSAIEVYTTANVLVPLTTVGSGSHEMLISRSLTAEPAVTLTVSDHGFVNGTPMTVISDSLLPSPLSAATTYFIRSVDLDLIEIYATQAQAEDTASTVGRVTFLSTGTGNHRLIVSRVPVSVRSILSIEKPRTDGYIRLYAWDTSRTNNIALLGDFHPNETLPSYRRIRINQSATSVRLKYRRRPSDVLTERDFINLDSRMAIVMMVQSQELLFKKFIDESEKYRMIAIEYLNKRNRAIDGPRAPTFQMNADVTTRPDDWMD
jgi:hypothetical protein